MFKLFIAVIVLFLLAWSVLYYSPKVFADEPVVQFGDDDLIMPSLVFKGRHIMGENPDYYPKYWDIIHLTGNVNYANALQTVDTCYQLTFKVLYGDSFATHVGYRVIEEPLWGISYAMDTKTIFSCSGHRIINKRVEGGYWIASGIHS